MRDRARFLLSTALVLAVVSAALPAAAQDSGQLAGELLKTGLAEMAAKRYDKACPLLLKSYRAEQRAETLFNLARCEEDRGRVATAAARYDEYFAVVATLTPAEQAAERQRQTEAGGRRPALDAVIPTVKLILPADAPEGTRVTRVPLDGGDPVDMAVGVALPLDPGDHVISTQVSDGPRTDKAFRVNRGDRNKEVKLTVTLGNLSGRVSWATAPRATALPPVDPGTSAWRISAITIGAVGVAGILAGFITGAVTLAQKSVIAANCAQVTDPKTMMMMPQVCNPVGVSAANTAHTWGLASTATFIAGGALLATGIILYVTEPAPPRLQGALPAQPATGALSPIRRSWVTLGVASADAHGATVGAAWSW